jgi:spermidine synthase
LDLLSHFVSGTEGVKDYARGGIINTDDNLYLEFSSPFSVGMPVMENNVRAVMRHRERLQPYLAPSATGESVSRLEAIEKAAPLTDEAHALFLGNRYRTPAFKRLADILERDHPEFAPWRFLKAEVARELANTPVTLQRAGFSLMDSDRNEINALVAATKIRLGEGFSVLIFTDHNNSFMGQLPIDEAVTEGDVKTIIDPVFMGIGKVYQEEAMAESLRGRKYPDEKFTMKRIREYLGNLSKEAQ